MIRLRALQSDVPLHAVSRGDCEQAAASHPPRFLLPPSDPLKRVAQRPHRQRGEGERLRTPVEKRASHSSTDGRITPSKSVKTAALAPTNIIRLLVLFCDAVAGAEMPLQSPWSCRPEKHLTSSRQGDLQFPRRITSLQRRTGARVTPGLTNTRSEVPELYNRAVED